MKRSTKIFLLFLLAVVLLVSACGGSAWIEEYQDAMTAQAEATAVYHNPLDDAIRSQNNQQQLQNHMFGGNLDKGD